MRDKTKYFYLGSDWKNVMDTAIEEKLIEIARSLKKDSVDPLVITKTTRLSLSQIEKL